MRHTYESRDRAVTPSGNVPLRPLLYNDSSLRHTTGAETSVKQCNDIAKHRLPMHVLETLQQRDIGWDAARQSVILVQLQSDKVRQRRKSGR